MSIDTAFVPLLVVMAAVAFFSRAGGFLLMRYVPATPAIEAALKATPLAVMVGIVTPAAARGSLPELAALSAVFIAMRVTGNDLVSAILGTAVVAVLRLATG